MSYPRRAQPYRPSASLIHEIRMIAQSFFSHRTTASIFGSERSESSKLLCVPCLEDRKNNKAVAINNGKSVCRIHL